MGQDGFRIVQFRMERLANQPEVPGVPESEDDPAHASTTIVRRIRNTKVAQQIKDLYDNTCQVCDREVLISSGRAYSEGAHIRPLVRPHVGPDTAANILCLCPNHHVQLDMGVIYITDDYRVVDRSTGCSIGPLHRKPSHFIDPANLEYHRNHIALSVKPQ